MVKLAHLTINSRGKFCFTSCPTISLVLFPFRLALAMVLRLPRLQLVAFSVVVVFIRLADHISYDGYIEICTYACGFV